MSTATPDLLTRVRALPATERASLLAELTALAKAERTPLSNLSQDTATPVAFIADLEPVGIRVHDPRYLGKGTFFFLGHDGMRGPRGGVYLAGRCTVGKSGNKAKGILKIASQKFQRLLAGDPVEAWVRLDGEARDISVGLLTNYRPYTPKRSASTT